MTAETKNLVFKGVPKKEEILFKSFLNLAKNDLNYQIAVIADGAEDPLDILILDESHQLNGEAQKLSSVPTVMIGDDVQKESDAYLVRPVQWSEFKHAITCIDFSVGEKETSAEVELQVTEQILPSNIEMQAPEELDAQSEVDINPRSKIQTDKAYSDEGDYEFELDDPSAVDFHSFTNSDYAKAAEDVKDFGDGDPDSEVVKDQDQIGVDNKPVVLVTDDESSSSNSVVVIETNSMDLWDFSESEFSEENIDGESEFSEMLSEEEVVLQKRAGFEIKQDEVFWNEDNELIVDNQTYMFVKPERNMVYSEAEPGEWANSLQKGELAKAPIPSEWRPTSGLKAYPMHSLVWAHTLINKTSREVTPFGDDDNFQLESWPDFELLQLDNILLKLCTMLYVRPESVQSLSHKSGYGLSTIRGFMNACDGLGCLKKPEQITGDKVASGNDEGMFGKIKDVFR